MKLPSYVLECLNALEAAGYPAYAVGGCVRDACLGLQPHDYDICTAAVPQQTEAVFAGKKLVLAGEKHGTVGVESGPQPLQAASAPWAARCWPRTWTRSCCGSCSAGFWFWSDCRRSF